MLGFALVSLLNPTGFPALQKEQKTIKIGVLAPLTGKVSLCGKDMVTALDLAAKEINEEYGADEITLIYEDTQFDPKIAITAAQKLIQQDNVKVIVGACNSSATLAVAPIAEEAKVILFSPTSFSEKISNAGEYVFRSQLRPSEEAPFIANLIVERLGEKRVAMIYLNNDYGVSYYRELEKELQKRNASIITAEAFDPSEVDYKTILLKVKESKANVLFLAGSSNVNGIIVKQAFELGTRFQIIATNPIERREVLQQAGNAAEGIIFSSLVDYSVEGRMGNNELDQFFKGFEENYPNDYVNTMRASNYDALKILAKIMLRKCGENTECIKNELYSVKDYQGATGIFSINKNGDAEHEDIYFYRIRGGEFVPYE